MTIQRKLMSKVFVLILIIFVVNFLAMKFHWYSILWWFDMPMHTIGGFWVALTSLTMYRFRKTTRDDISNHTRIFLVSILAVVIVGLSWEIFEFGLQTIGTISLANPIDSLSDMFFDIAGGILGTLFFINRYERVIKELDNV